MTRHDPSDPFGIDPQKWRVVSDHIIFNNRLMEFAKESNRIEGVTDADDNERMFKKLEAFLKLEKLTLDNVCDFNEWGILREMESMNVSVGGRLCLPGGKSVTRHLELIINTLDKRSAYSNHFDFERLHPFTDGNGRTGRAIWLWQMVRQHDYDLSIGFLHKFYYQVLSQ